MENLKPPENTSPPPPPIEKKTQSPHLTKSLARPLRMKSLSLEKTLTSSRKNTVHPLM